jgi:hypothetical protein
MTRSEQARRALQEAHHCLDLIARGARTHDDQTDPSRDTTNETKERLQQRVNLLETQLDWATVDKIMDWRQRRAPRRAAG